MERGCVRRFGAKAKVRLAIAACLAIFAAKPARAIELAETETEPGVVVYPAKLAGPRAITVVLHGMCSEPARACRHFAEHVTRTQHLVCPRASQRCEGGGSIWPQTRFAEQIEAAVERAKQLLPELPDERNGRTLIGYSLGAFRALTMAQQSAGKYPRVMLIGAKVFPNQNLLQQNGVQRLLISAGSWDMMHDHMQRETKRLARAGFPVRFLGLGPVGHLFTPSFSEYLPSALGWLEGDQ